MKHFIRTAFWIFTLFGCLLAIPRRLMETHIADSDFDVDILRENIECEQNSTFYIQQNVKPECITAALNCFSLEFNGTVLAECEDPTNEVSDVLWLLDNKIKTRVSDGHVLNTSTACACEQGPGVSFTAFLNGLKDLLQQEKAAKKQ